MYIIINNETQKANTANQKTVVAEYIGVHRNTITNNLKLSNPAIIKGFTVYEGTFLKNNVTSGNTYNLKDRHKRWLEKNSFD